MTPPELREAMRYGAERDYKAPWGSWQVWARPENGVSEPVSKAHGCQPNNPKRAEITAFSWDLDHIERTNRWEVIPSDRNNLGPAIRNPLKDTDWRRWWFGKGSTEFSAISIPTGEWPEATFFRCVVISSYTSEWCFIDSWLAEVQDTRNSRFY